MSERVLDEKPGVAWVRLLQHDVISANLGAPFIHPVVHPSSSAELQSRGLGEAHITMRV